MDGMVISGIMNWMNERARQRGKQQKYLHSHCLLYTHHGICGALLGHGCSSANSIRQTDQPFLVRVCDVSWNLR